MSTKSSLKKPAYVYIMVHMFSTRVFDPGGCKSYRLKARARTYLRKSCEQARNGRLAPPPTASSDWISAQQLPGDSEVADDLPSQHPKERTACRRGLTRPESTLLSEPKATPRGGKGGGGSQCHPPPYR